VRTGTSRPIDLVTALAVLLSIAALAILATGCSERSPLVPVSYVEPPGPTATGIGSGTATVGSGSATIATPTTTVTPSDTTGAFDLSGSVYDSVTAAGVPNVTVTTSAGHNVKTLSNGRFYLTAVPSGIHTISLSASDYEDFSYAFTLASSGALQPPLDVFITRKTYTIRGYVVNKGSAGDSSMGYYEEAIDGVDVAIEGLASFTTTTTSNGAFTFAGLKSGLYTIVAQKPGSFEKARVQVEIKPDGTVSPAAIVISLSPSSFSMQGLVKLDSTKEPLGGIRIDLLDQDSTSVAWTLSTAEGKFSFLNLPAGLMYLTAQGDGFYNATAVVQIFQDGSISPATPELFLTRLPSENDLIWASGTIRDAYTAGPLEFVTVILKGYASTITDRYGYYSLGNIAPGRYQLTFTKEGFNQLDVALTVNADGTTSPPSLDYFMIYTQGAGQGSIVGRYVPSIPPESGLPVAVYQIYSESATNLLWTLVSPYTPIKTTVTGADSPLTSSNESGIFKFTHLNPTTSNRKYLIVVGEGGNTAPEYGEDYKILTIPPGVRKFYFIVDVVAGQTTFVTNYEQENF